MVGSRLGALTSRRGSKHHRDRRVLLCSMDSEVGDPDPRPVWLAMVGILRDGRSQATVGLPLLQEACDEDPHHGRHQGTAFSGNIQPLPCQKAAR